MSGRRQSESEGEWSDYVELNEDSDVEAEEDRRQKTDEQLEQCTARKNVRTKDELKLTADQATLVNAVNDGKNVLICEAFERVSQSVLKLINDHLSSKDTMKVVLITDTANAVSRLTYECKRFLPFTCVGIGMNKSNRTLRHHLTADVLVLTAQSLLNALEEADEFDRIPSLSATFSMLVLTHAEKCHAAHPYARLMQIYRTEKDNCTEATCLPIIIALSGTPWVLTAPNTKDAVKNVLQLCANLEVERLHKLPSDDAAKSIETRYELCPPRASDDFHKEMDKLIVIFVEKLNNMLRNSQQDVIKDLSGGSNEMKNLFLSKAAESYSSFVGNAKRSLSTMTESVLKRRLLRYYKVIGILSASRTLNSEVRTIDAYNYLYSKLNADEYNIHLRPESSFDPEEFRILKQCNDALPRLEACCNAEAQALPKHQKPSVDASSVNAKLIKLKAELVESLFVKGKALEGSCVVVLVSSKKTSAALEKWCSSDPLLGRLNAAVIDTKTVKRALARENLQSGQVQLLIATEAWLTLSVPNCKKVICYCYFPSEISYLKFELVLIANTEMKLAEEARLAVTQRAIMEKAFNRVFISFDSTDTQQMLLELKEETYCFTRQKTSVEKKPAGNILCGHCSALFTSTNNLVLGGENMYLCIDTNLSRVLRVPDAPDAGKDSIVCSSCCAEVAKVLNFEGQQFIGFNIEGIAFEDAVEKSRPLVPQWSAIPFPVPKLQRNLMMQYAAGKKKLKSLFDRLT